MVVEKDWKGHPLKFYVESVRLWSVCVSLLTCFGLSLPVVAQDAPRELTALHWNTENLFDSDDDPANPGDDEFLPHTFKLWTSERYALKLDHLTEVLSPLKADFITLSEVENRRVLRDLAERIEKATGLRYPYIIHRDGPDHRGIDVAIISQHAAVSTNWITPVPEQRDVLFADFEIDGAPLMLCVNHWKSHFGSAHETLPQRMQQAKAVRAEVDARLTVAPDAAIVVMGDFNDNYEAATLVLGLKSITDRPAVLKSRSENYLYNLHDGLRRGRDGTYYSWYGFSWCTFDSISVSPGMLDEARQARAGWQVAPKSYRVYKPARVVGERGRPNSFRRLRDRDTNELKYQEGYSDHYPVVVTLRRRS